MNEAQNNEMDLMLRSLARRQRNTTPGTTLSGGNGDNVSTDHLDADELNAYAEGALPPATRARYTQHLAECDSCRGLIVGLAQSAPATREAVASEQSAGFWQRLTSVFSPAVLRFAVPALLLTAVIGVTLIALRQRSTTSEVAKNEGPPAVSSQAQSAKPNAQVQQAVASPSSVTPSSSAPAADKLTERAKVEPTVETEVSDNTKAKVAEEKVPVADKPPLVAKDASTAPAEQGGASSAYLAQPKAAPAPAAPATINENDKYASLDRAQKREDQRQRDEVNRAEDIHGPNRGAAQQNAGPMNSRSATFGLKKNAQAESRTVAGRTFVREGNSWIDTAYESSHELTRVTRGSEQYRALVADEPAIRTIAQELDGVVIVVWKGHAYRIQ